MQENLRFLDLRKHFVIEKMRSYVFCLELYQVLWPALPTIQVFQPFQPNNFTNKGWQKCVFCYF